MFSFNSELSSLGYATYNEAYDWDVTLVKELSGDLYKVIFCRCIRKKGFEKEERAPSKHYHYKLQSSISRAKSKVLELALCNDFYYFVTLTLDKNKHDRFDLENYHSELSKFLKAYNRYKSEDQKVKYLLIPERHKDGAYHMHGLFSKIPESDLRINSNGYLEWIPYTKKFGYMSLGKIKDTVKCAAYITKYITKDLGGDMEVNQHLYYCSRGLKRARLIVKGSFDNEEIEWDFVHPDGYTKVKMYDSSDFLQELTLLP